MNNRILAAMHMHFLLSIFVLLFLHGSHSINPIHTNTNSRSYCNLSSLPNPLTLSADKLTVLINGYSPSRISLHSFLVLSYSSHSSVSSIIMLWFNFSPPPKSFLSILSPSISLHLHSSSSLTARFLPRPQILTRSVLNTDDDIQIPASSLSFAFRISLSHQNSYLSFFARFHDLDLDLDLDARSWIYTVHPDRYSNVLTKFMILNMEYLYRFSCGDDMGMAEARAVVERERNCEDILMNFVVALETGVLMIIIIYSMFSIYIYCFIL